jgi:hypothetical protein
MRNDAFLCRVCPICGSKPPTEITISSTVKAESLGFNELVSHWNGFFKDKVLFSYVRCGSCGLLYAPVFFDCKQLEDLYGQMPPNMSDVPLEALQRTQYGYFNALKRHSKLIGSFIEVGPDIGLFTKNCITESNFDEYWLFEPNRDVLPALIDVVKERKHHIIHDMFGFSCVPDHTSTVVVLVHVLDHLVNPVSTLHELHDKLTPDGVILFVTHDESSLLRHIAGWRWPAFCLQHPQIYNPKTMRILLEKAGYRVVQQNKTVNYFPVKFLLKHLLWAFGIKVCSVPSFGSISLGLKLGNLLTIATPEGK